MGERCTLSGHIQEPWYFRGSDAELRILMASNKRVIESLPRADEWPFLVRGMFSFSPSGRGCDPHLSTTYRGRVIYFGGSFSKLYTDWAEWLDKFEALLRRLYWEHAVVVHVTELMGLYTHRWEASDSAVEQFSARPPVPVQEWKFTGGPRTFD